MSNSKLVSYTRLSPNHSGKRTHSIDRITPHCVVGQLTAEGIAACFASKSRQASCQYGIGKDGAISLIVDEANRSWCTSSNANDQRAITIECASNTTDPYAMNTAVYDSLVKLCVDICKRNGKKKLLWFSDKSKALNYSPKSDEMVLTVHRWFANKACPGDWLYSRLGTLASTVTKQLVVTGWQKINGIWYYFNSNGDKLTGWQKIKGVWYYLKSDGAMAIGWVKVNGKWYYLKSNGAMATGWIKTGGKWYYLKSSGAMATGWLKDNGKWYYLNSSGAMVTGTVKIDGKEYTFADSGAWIK